MELALQNGYEVEVVCFEFSNWSYDFNEQLKKKFPGVKMHAIPAGRKPFLPWMLNATTEAGSRLVGKLVPLSKTALSQAVSRRSRMIIKALKNVVQPDWVIGHNPGALYATLIAKRKFNCKAGFDVEDYHPGEGNNAYMQGLARQLMEQTLPQMNYVSFASPLIMEQVQHDCDVAPQNWFTVLNYFPAGEFSEPVNKITGPARMVWFSQNINAGRGLELVLPFVQNANDKMELHLFGNLNADFYNAFLKGVPNIIIHPPMAQHDLHQSLAQFDIGLALEPAKDKNNELAVSNKILAYLQAGLFVVATNTAAQEWLLNEFPGHGLCFDYRGSGTKSVLEKVVTEIDAIRSLRNKRYATFENGNWEVASLDLLKRWEEK